MTDALEIAEALGYAAPPMSWPTTSDPTIPVGLFGKDHWSTFAYVETRTVDHKGVLNHDHMRCDETRHPLWANAGKRSRHFASSTPGSLYPTRLKGGAHQPDHDDYDCLDDLIAAGLLAVQMPEAPSGVLVTGLIEKELALTAHWSLTDLGREVAGRLRSHLADQRTYANFDPQIPRESHPG